MLSHKRTLGSNPSDARKLVWQRFDHSRSKVTLVPEELPNGMQGACGACKNGNRPRPRFVIAVFSDSALADGAAERLRCGTADRVSILSNSLPVLAHDLDGFPALACGRLYRQITHHLDAGASIVVIDVQSPEQQLGISRVLLESKCDLLLTHDGTRHVD
jgi:hypothetical protein